MNEKFQDILRLGLEMGASDILMKADHPPVFRVGSRYRTSSLQAESHSDLLDLLKRMISPSAYEKFQEDLEIDFSLNIPGVNRFRVSAFQQSRALALVLRLIPARLPTLESVQLSPKIVEAATRSSGLVLIGGPAASGKSTTGAAILDWINHQKETRIITLENPVEFVFRDAKSDVLQREYRRDFASFAEALSSSLRHDPDIIFVGEMREMETVELALQAAEMGHLVISSITASSSSSVIQRICSMFSLDSRPFILEQLASNLVCILTQVLVTLADASSRQTAAREVLLNTPAMAHLIRSGKHDQISSYLENSKDEGMVSLNAGLESLVARGVIKAGEALARSPEPETLMTRLAKRGGA